MPFGWGAPDSALNDVGVFWEITESPMPFGWGAPDSAMRC